VFAHASINFLADLLQPFQSESRALFLESAEEFTRAVSLDEIQVLRTEKLCS
jgi:hypothetical protein